MTAADWILNAFSSTRFFLFVANSGNFAILQILSFQRDAMRCDVFISFYFVIIIIIISSEWLVAD